MKIDYKIKKVLHILSNNSRTTSKEIAKEIKTSQQNASYLINKLEEEKIIKNYKILIDSSKFSLNNFCVFLKLKKYSKSELNNFIVNLKKYNEIIAIDILFGNFDIFLKFSTPNPSHFNKILNQIIRENPNKIFDFQILTQIVQYNYPHNFLSKKNFETKTIISGDREYISTNKIEKEILNYLNENSRINYSFIANKLNTTSKTIISKIRKLENLNIIKGYSININYNKLNHNKYYLFLKFDLKELKDEKKLKDFFQTCPNIIENLKIFGKWDNILIIETVKTNDFKKILFSLKEEFSEILQDYDFLESEDTRMWKYIPKLE